jgi:SH3 domain-containing YSC84-like protein 1
MRKFSALLTPLVLTPLVLPTVITTAITIVTAMEQPVTAEVNPAARIELAAGVLEKFVTDPRERIPANLLRSAQGIAIIPNIVQAGFIVGGRRGVGIVMVRDAQGNWTNPAFVTLTGGSLGLQFGAQSSDVVLIFRNRGAVTELLRDNFSLGGNVSVSAGPIGGDIVNPTDPNTQIYAYARNEGLFAGVALEGAKVAFDAKTSQRYYGQPSLTARRIFNGGPLQTGPEVTDLRDVLVQATQARR